MKGAVAFCSGLLFALGLGLSGMTEPHIVRGFLDVTGDWDWRLLGVMAGAIVVHAVAYRFIAKRRSPLLAPEFQLPTKSLVDARLVAGAVLFGLGWGWVGICPGPGIVAAVSGHRAFLLFTAAMLVGMKSFHLAERRMR